MLKFREKLAIVENNNNEEINKEIKDAKVNPAIKAIIKYFNKII